MPTRLDMTIPPTLPLARGPMDPNARPETALERMQRRRAFWRLLALDVVCLALPGLLLTLVAKPSRAAAVWVGLAVVVVVAGCLALWGQALDDLDRPAEWHHFHLGVLALVAAVGVGAFWRTPFHPLVAVLAGAGLASVVDDTAQHAMQARLRRARRRVWPEWSPGHMLGRYVIFHPLARLRAFRASS